LGITDRPVGWIDFGAVQTGLSDSPLRVGQYSEFNAWPGIGIPVQGMTGCVSVLESVDFHRPPPPIAPTASLLATYAADARFTALPYWRSACAAGGQRKRCRVVRCACELICSPEKECDEAGQRDQGAWRHGGAALEQ
jgi:hypothetical protein